MHNVLRSLVRKVIDQLPPRLQCQLTSLRSRVDAKVGTGTFIHTTVQMLGKAHIRVGSNSVLSQECWLNVNQRICEQVAIDIGNHSFIGRRNFFSSGKGIVIGDYVLTGNDCHFLGSSHVVSDPTRPCLTTGTTATDLIVVGHNTFFGAGAKVLGHVTIGHGCVVGACALVTRDVPPFSQVAGFPATVRRRYSFPRRIWVDTDAFTQEDEAAIPSADAYLTTLRSHGAPRMPYLAAGSDMGQC